MFIEMSFPVCTPHLRSSESNSFILSNLSVVVFLVLMTVEAAVVSVVVDIHLVCVNRRRCAAKFLGSLILKSRHFELHGGYLPELGPLYHASTPHERCDHPHNNTYLFS